MTVIVTDRVTGLPLDLTPATGILVGIYHEGFKTLAKWSKNVKTGFQTMDLTNASTGIIVVYITVNETIGSIRQKMLKGEVKVKFPDASSPAGHVIAIDTNVEIEEVENSIFEGIDT